MISSATMKIAVRLQSSTISSNCIEPPYVLGPIGSMRSSLYSTPLNFKYNNPKIIKHLLTHNKGKIRQ